MRELRQSVTHVKGSCGWTHGLYLLTMQKTSTEDRSVFASFCIYGFRVPWAKKTAAFPVPDGDVLFLSISSTSYSELPFVDIAQAAKVFAKQSWIPCSVPSASSTINETLQILRTDPNAYSDLGFLIRFRRSEVDEQSPPPEVQRKQNIHFLSHHLTLQFSSVTTWHSTWRHPG